MFSCPMLLDWLFVTKCWQNRGDFKVSDGSGDGEKHRKKFAFTITWLKHSYFMFVIWALLDHFLYLIAKANSKANQGGLHKMME